MSTTRPRFVAQLPEPGRGWITRRPGRWASCDHIWTDLASAQLVAGSVAHAPPSRLSETSFPKDLVDELVYVPPVALVHRDARDGLVDDLLDASIPVVVQLTVGEAPGWRADADSVIPVYDLTAPLLAGELARLDALPKGAWSIWPLVPGISDDAEMLRAGCRRLADHGVHVVQPMTVEVPPALAQQLATGRAAAVFDALFHGPRPEERSVAPIVSGQGLSIWPRRPETGGTERVRTNRRLAAALALAAELWLRLDRPQAAGQALYRAARGIESTGLDVVAIMRDGNLRVLDFVDDRAAAILEATAQGDEPTLLRELRVAYVGAS